MRRLREVLTSSFIGPIVVAYLITLGLRVIVTVFEAPLTAAVIKIANAMILQARPQTLMTTYASWGWGGFANLKNVLIHFGLAVALAAYLYRRSPASARTAPS